MGSLKGIKAMKQIRKIVIEKILDENPHLDYLGEFSDTAGEFAIEHEKYTNRTYKYFNAANVENKKQAMENYRRMMLYENGTLCDYGVMATAEVLTSFDTGAKMEGGKILKGNWLINKIHSGGLWGLSSDGEQADFDNEAQNQKDELKDVLLEFGFTEDQINLAEIEYKNW